MAGLLDWWRGDQGSPIDGAPMYPGGPQVGVDRGNAPPAETIPQRIRSGLETGADMLAPGDVQQQLATLSGWSIPRGARLDAPFDSDVPGQRYYVGEDGQRVAAEPAGRLESLATMFPTGGGGLLGTAPRGALGAGPMRTSAGRVPRMTPQNTLYTTSEQIPGASTGLLPHLLEADMPAKQAFSDRAGWGDALGRDVIHQDMGFTTQPSRHGVGAYRNAAGRLEHNPVAVGRPLVDTVRNPETGLPQTHPGSLQAIQGGEAARGLLDFQEGAAGNRVNVQGSGPGRTALAVRTGHMPTQDEMAQLEAVSSRHGLVMGNADNGVNLLNFDDAATTRSVGKALRGGLRQELQEALPGSTVQRGRGEAPYVDYTKDGAISYENRGKGMATTILMDELEKTRAAAPAMYENLLDSAGVQGKARENLSRLLEAGGGGQRPDYEELLRLVGEGKLRGLMDRVAKLGVKGLPAAGGLGLTGGLLAEDDARGQAR